MVGPLGPNFRDQGAKNVSKWSTLIAISKTVNIFKIGKVIIEISRIRYWHVNVICSWPKVDDDVISSRRYLKIFKDYLGVNFKVASLSRFIENRNKVFV